MIIQVWGANPFYKLTGTNDQKDLKRTPVLPVITSYLGRGWIRNRFKQLQIIKWTVLLLLSSLTSQHIIETKHGTLRLKCVFIVKATLFLLVFTPFSLDHLQKPATSTRQGRSDRSVQPHVTSFSTGAIYFRATQRLCK